MNINASLHSLWRVIDCLNNKAKGKSSHIPYRDSMMTMVLRDSLGGNCKTKMIATVSVDSKPIVESISTCRFARSVSAIKNVVSRNEEVDPGLII
jgi:kinesin family protein 6/9